MSHIRSWLRARATYANVMSTLAVFLIVSGGTAYAANAVLEGRDLRNKSVSTQKLANGAVTSQKVRNGSLQMADLSPATRSKLKGTQGPAGPAGPSGVKGDPGPQGPAGSARAVATVSGDVASDCTVHTEHSRGAASCDWVSKGRYRIKLDSAVSLIGTYPVCSIGSDSGNPADRRTCAAWISNAGVKTITVQVFTADEKANTPAVGLDVPQHAPVVVMIP